MQQRVMAVLPVLLAFSVACSETSQNPLRPSATLVGESSELPGSHGHKLTAMLGEGEGIVNVSPDASQPGFSVETQVAVWKSSPNTTFIVSRAVDFTADGICTSTNFVPLPRPNPGPLVTLTTSPGGAGSVHVSFALPQIPDNTELDVRFQVSTADGSIMLRTECFTVTAR